jgi:hypothetical protein
MYLDYQFFIFWLSTMLGSNTDSCIQNDMFLLTELSSCGHAIKIYNDLFLIIFLDLIYKTFIYFYSKQ